MSSRTEGFSERRIAGVLALVLSVAMISGCGALPSARILGTATPTATDATDEAAASEPTPSAPERRGPEDLSFESGAALDPSQWRVQWLPPLTEADGFAVLDPDDGNGSWSHTDDATGCELYFYQGAIFDLAAGVDDRTLSDDLIWAGMSGTVSGATREDVATHAFDDEVPLYVDAGTVPVRILWGTGNDGDTWLFASRMFGSLGGGVTMTIFCPPGQDAYDEFAKVTRDYLFIDVGPGTT